MRKKILFISHDASNTGAPKLLLSIVEYFATHENKFSIDILFLSGGKLIQEFKKYANVHLREDFTGRGIVGKFVNKIFRTSYIDNRLVKSLQKNRYDVVYGNTILSLKWLNMFSKQKAKTILHIHESSYLFNLFFRDKVCDFTSINHIITVSNFVREFLFKEYKISDSKITLAYPFIVDNLKPTIEKSRVKDNLGLRDEIVLGCMGYTNLAKGTDLIPQICKRIQKAFPDLKFKFLVVGGSEDSEFVITAKMDARKLGVSDFLIFIENTSMPQNYFNILDLYLCLSREESFSLAVLNAASMRIPIICFRDNGGPSEILDERSAFFVNYLDLEDIIEKLGIILHNEELVQQKITLAKKFVDFKFSIDDSCATISNQIMKLIG